MCFDKLKIDRTTDKLAINL